MFKSATMDEGRMICGFMLAPCLVFLVYMYVFRIAKKYPRVLLGPSDSGDFLLLSKGLGAWLFDS